MCLLVGTGLYLAFSSVGVQRCLVYTVYCQLQDKTAAWRRRLVASAWLLDLRVAGASKKWVCSWAWVWS